MGAGRPVGAREQIEVAAGSAGVDQRDAAESRPAWRVARSTLGTQTAVTAVRVAWSGVSCAPRPGRWLSDQAPDDSAHAQPVQRKGAVLEGDRCRPDLELACGCVGARPGSPLGPRRPPLDRRGRFSDQSSGLATPSAYAAAPMLAAMVLSGDAPLRVLQAGPPPAPA